MANQLLFCCLIIFVNSCSQLYNNTMFLTGTLNEVINIPLSQIFINWNNEKITFQQAANDMKIVAPLQLYLEQNLSDKVNSQVISSKLFKSIRSRAPIQHLTALVNQTGYFIYQNVGIYQTLPQVKHVFACKEKQNSICNDVVELKTLTIIECQDTLNNSYFNIVKNEDVEYLDIEKPNSDFHKLDQIDSYLIRGTLNKIDLYIEEQEKLRFLKSLDEQALIALLQKDDFKLSITDFQYHTNGQISIMNAFGEIIVIEYKNDNWELIKIIDTEMDEIQGYDFDIYTDTYVIITKSQIKYRQIDKEDQIQEFLNFDKSNKIYLTKGYLLFHQKQGITLFTQELTKVQILNLVNEKFQMITNPYSQGFIVVSDSKTYAYAINNEYFIQTSFNQMIEQDQQKVVLKQNNYPNDCVITIYFKAADINQDEILTQQYPEGLIAQGVYEDNVKVKFRSVFQGSNLQYNFQPNKNLTITVNQFQNAQLKNITELKNIAYRKILSRKFQPKLYLMEQDSNLQLIGYSCTNFVQVQLNCHLLFINPEFIKLSTNSNQLWWYNEDSFFFAVFEDLSITIYAYVYQDKKFEKLTSIVLESNVRQITTDGYHLFASTAQYIKIYSITVLNKEKLLLNLEVQADKLYASEAQQNYIFLEVAETLYIYNIEYYKETLVGFIEINNDYEESNLAIFDNHFVRLTKTKDKEEYIVKVFNFENKNHIYLQKLIGLNNYSQINLNSLDYSFSNNLFSLIGKNTKTLKHVVLIYSIKSNSLDSLFSVVEVASTTAQISATGEYIFITETNQEKLKILYITGKLFIKAKLDENYQQVEYMKELTLNLEVINDSSNKLITRIPVNIVNRGVKLFQIYDKFNLTYKSDQNHCVDLGQAWYSGQALDIDLVQSSKKVQFNPILTKQKETLEFSPLIQEFDNNTLVQLMDNKITLVKKSDLSIIEFELDDKYAFRNLFFIDGDNLYVQAYTDDSIELRIIQCKKQNCVLLENKLEFNSKIKNAYLHMNNFFCYIQDKVVVYNTKGDAIMLESFEKIQEFQQYDGLIQMEFKHLKNNVYQFISVDYYGNPEFQMREISNTSTINFFVRYQINILIAEQKINVQQQQYSAGFVLRKDEIIIIFTNSASYSFHYEMDCQENNLCDITKFQFNGLYQQYGNWQLIRVFPIFYMSENFLHLIYYASTQSVLLIYDLQTSSSNSKPNNAIIGIASPVSIAEQLYQIMSFVYSFNGKLHLLASAEDKSKLQHYIIQRSSQLCIDENTFEDSLKFKLQNPDYIMYLDEQVKINEYVPPSPNDDDTKGFPIWAILLIVLGVVAIIGLGLFIYCRGKRNRIKDQKLLLAQF